MVSRRGKFCVTTSGQRRLLEIDFLGDGLNSLKIPKKYQEENKTYQKFSETYVQPTKNPTNLSKTTKIKLYLCSLS